MAIVVSRRRGSPATQDIEYTITGLVNGANAIVLPTPPVDGSFPPDGSWTPTTIKVFPYQQGAVAAKVSPDLSTITQVAGVVTFTLWADGNTNCIVAVN